MSRIDYNLCIPTAYSDIIKLLIECRGCIFGGAVRDFIRGDTPKDLDVSVLDYILFYDGLIAKGYLSDEDTPSKLTKDGIVIDVNEIDDPDTIVDLNVRPDFDVNMLAWDGRKLFNYNDPDYDITEILENIKMKRAMKISPDNKRLEKMKSKGWEIL